MHGRRERATETGSTRRVLATAAAVGALLLLGWSPAPAQQLAPAEVPTIRVTGFGQVDARPDEATLRFAVETAAETAQEAARENARIMDRVIAALTAAGVPRDAIETRNFAVHPEYAHRPEVREPELTGYRARNEVELTTTRLAELGRLIDTALEAGANRFDGVTFGLRNAEPVRAEALREAVAQARASAEVIAAALGVRLGRVLDAGTSMPPVRPMATAYRLEARAGMDMAEAMPTPIEPGEQTVHAQVSIVYEIAAP